MRPYLLPILKHQKFTGVQKPTTRILFTKVPNPKKPMNTISGLMAAAVTTTVIASNNDTTEKEQEELTPRQAHINFQNHVMGVHCSELVESAKVLGLYGCHSDGKRKFFRGEKLSKNKIDELEKNLDTALELERNTHITSSLGVARNFLEPNLLDYLNGFVSIKGEDIRSENRKRMPVLYEINIPKDFKFIEIPDKKYSDPRYETPHCFSEKEYVIPMGSLIKVTKSDTYDADSGKRHYTIHVLENPNP